MHIQYLISWSQRHAAAGRRFFRRQHALLALAAFMALPLLPAEALVLHVAPQGNDAWSGRLAAPLADKTDGPLATLAQARDRIRKLKSAGPLPQGGIVVELSSGIYELPGPLELQAQDSGSEEAPIVYRARKGDTVRLVGGKVVTLWRPVTDKAILARLDESARGHVLQADLKALGIRAWDKIKPGLTWAQSEPGLELFFAEEPMTLARWPNAGFVKIPAVLGPTPVDVRGTKGCQEGVFSYEGDRPSRWGGEKDIMLHGYWFWDWADQRLKVESIDLQRHVITLASKPQHSYGFRKGQWYYAYNLLSELDRPGEWYLDRDQGILYFWPPAPIQSGQAMVSMLPSLVVMKNVSHVTLRGLVLECTRGTAVTVAGGKRVRLVGCTIRNVGNSGASLTGVGHAVLGCDIYNTANNGVTLDGGDRKRLTPAGLTVENCHIHHFSRWNPVYKPAVMVQGVGNRVAHNLMHDSPHMAIAFSGNDHVIEFNEIHSVVYQSNDAGVMYAGYNPTMRGHEIRYNYIHHIYGHEGRGCVGVYLDDMFCSAHIHGNVFFQVPQAAFVGGGRDNLIENNIFVDCNPAVHVDARALGWAAAGVSLLRQRLQEMPYQDEPWRSRFPQLLNYLEDEPAVPKGNVVARNICWGGRWDSFEKKALPHIHFQDNLLKTDPHFVDAKGANFQLRDDSPAWKLGFQRIPTEKIGLYASEDRASWPVKHTVRPRP
jgi:hypothetical protein